MGNNDNGNLNDNDRIGLIRALLASDVWNRVIKPVIAERGRQAMTAMANPPALRSPEFKGVKTNYLRGRLREDEWFLTWFEQEVQNWDVEQSRDESKRQEQKVEGVGSPYVEPPAPQ